MTLYTGCIYLPRSKTHGIRASVMSRHTLDDGITQDPRIIDYDEHLVELAPPPKLVGDYYRRGLPWESYEMEYRSFLGKREAMLYLLAERAHEYDITLLCKEETPEFCHRRILAEELLRIFTNLQVQIE